MRWSERPNKIGRSRNWPKSKLAEVEIGRSRNWPKSNWPNSKKKNWPKSKLAEVDHDPALRCKAPGDALLLGAPEPDRGLKNCNPSVPAKTSRPASKVVRDPAIGREGTQGPQSVKGRGPEDPPGRHACYWVAAYTLFWWTSVVLRMLGPQQLQTTPLFSRMSVCGANN